MKPLAEELAARRKAHLYRRRRVVEGRPGPEVVVEGKRVLSFCSNDYLGLAGHPEVVAALQRGARQYGVGSGAAHLLGGHCRPHHALEEELAAFTGRERALLFSTGYMANLGVISALLFRDDVLYQDRLNHASLIDAGLLARCRVRRYRHADVDALRRAMAQQTQGDAMVVTDGVFSMDGDLAPLPELARLARENRSHLMVDDAHGLGVLGREGGGSLQHWRLGVADVPVLMGTLGKALGGFGAFVAGSEALIETLVQKARTYIYTTAPPPAVAEAVRAALHLVREEPWRRRRLFELVAKFRRAAEQLDLPLMPSATPIQPIAAGTADRVLAWGRALEEDGILVGVIRPPTVPEGAARLRITLSAGHSDAQVDRLLDGLARLPRTHTT